MPKMIGDIKLPNKIPNLNHILFNGDKTEEFNKPKIKKIIDKIIDHTLRFPSLNNGNIDIIKKNIKNTIPKLLFELILILFFCKLRLMKVVSSCPLF